jgi:large subunit ribosomal protein L35
MPKMKTRSAAAKRFKVTASGKVMRKRGNQSHLKECKHQKTKLKARTGMFPVHSTDLKKIAKMLPYKG